MLKPAYLEVLRLLSHRLQDGGTWALTGSVGFALQGVPVVPRDIDVQSDEAGAYEIERRFAAFVVRPVTFSATDRIRSHFGALRVNGITVEIMGGVQKRQPDGSWAGPRRPHSSARICTRTRVRPLRAGISRADRS